MGAARGLAPGMAVILYWAGIGEMPDSHRLLDIASREGRGLVAIEPLDDRGAAAMPSLTVRSTNFHLDHLSARARLKNTTSLECPGVCFLQSYVIVR